MLGICRLSGIDPFNRLAEGRFSVHETKRVAMSRAAGKSVRAAVKATEEKLLRAQALKRLS
ncbi:MAG: hypothetical protein EOR84_26910 [Mesorhizobium sp.]|uniref:hypothetical protein n=1 Tax=Mesorhizobium sp. TaxID=1871066 RepID=UPI000FE875A4|nr:hypothetical protein [Mesorhizobium sp.]RWM88615.1 MAG: hypothetical protein EOR84_26910 [Mesorhizobium sp.]